MYEAWRVWDAGWDARWDDVGRDECPYVCGTPRRDWLDGWDACDDELSEQEDDYEESEL